MFSVISLLQFNALRVFNTTVVDLHLNEKKAFEKNTK